MNKRLTLAVLLGFATCGVIQAQQAPGIIWDKSIGGEGPENVNVITVSDDETEFITAGISYSTTHHAEDFIGGGDALVTQGIVSSGALLNTFNLGGGDLDDLLGVSKTPDGGHLFAGLANSEDLGFENKGLSDAWFVKLNAQGQVVWQTTFGGSHFDWAYKALELENGDVIFAGHTRSNDFDAVGPLTGETNVWVGRFNPVTNEMIWQNKFGGNNLDTAYDMVQGLDGSFYIVGRTNSTDVPNHKGDDDGYLLNIDGDGNLIWHTAFGGSSIDNFRHCHLDDVGNLVIGGNSMSTDGDLTGNHGSVDFWLLKISTLGEVIYSKNYGGTDIDRLYSIAKTHTGGTVAVGTTYSNNVDVTSNQGSNDFWVIEVDDEGTLLWQSTYGGSGGETALTVVPLTNGNFLVGGATSSTDGDISENLGNTDGWMIYIGENLSTAEVAANNTLNVYPNPVKDQLFVKSELPVLKTSIIDMSGRVLNTAKHNSQQVSLNTSALLPGVYILSIETEAGVQTQKIIKR
ncbi:MAG: T9SS type A sorting domain-containing protein [Weeksellaceae bacterium]|nr:T9SS type A sorting domain-containing protein [Weeksellaceae bacterium]